MRAAWLGLKGGIGGLAVALPTLVALRFAIGDLNFGLLPDLNSSSGWISVALILPCVAIIAHLGALDGSQFSLGNVLRLREKCELDGETIIGIGGSCWQLSVL